MKVLEYLKKHTVYLDGGTGTLLHTRGLKPGELPERLNLTDPDSIVKIHREYYDAGANIVCTNTFGANSLRFGDEELECVISAGVDNLNKARSLSSATQEKYTALDVGPIGRMLKPYGDLDFEDAVEAFAKTVRAGVRCGVDLIFIETMNDSYETKAALLAAKENSDLPVFVANAYGDDGKLMTGAQPSAMVAMLEGMGADAIGANCSLGPAQLSGVIDEYLRLSSVPVLLKPNAGLPHVENGLTCFDVGAEDFSDMMARFVEKGVRIVGGCCGTDPEFISRLIDKTKNIDREPLCEKNTACVSSYSHAVTFGDTPVLIGERINPTGKKRLKEAIRKGDITFILNEGLRQQEAGAHILDVNVGLPGTDEKETLVNVVTRLQSVTPLPLQLDTADTSAMERALRVYNGKAMINSVNGKTESMEAVFPLVKKYGGLVVCLTLDENGIPSDAKGRLKVAEKIVAKAKKYWIKEKDLIFDPLAMSVSADPRAALVTLESLRLIRDRLHCHTLLGVSNVSFGLPERDIVSAAFFSLALENGLSAAIMNPTSREIMRAYRSFRVLHGLDANCEDYIAAEGTAIPDGNSPVVSDESDSSLLRRAIIRGLREQASALTATLLETREPLDIVNGDIIPALDTVGAGFEKKTFFLPQLMMSAEASQAAFEQIKEKLTREGQKAETKGKFVIATVRGDIHDIGKNIVRLILENYGFDVTDLGKDVRPDVIVDETVRIHAGLVGLSALMTTTVPAMEETIKLLRVKAPWVKVVVGGAVLTKEYAESIGADYYASDAMATVRYALENSKK